MDPVRSRTAMVHSASMAKQRPFVGYIAWLIQRLTAIMLLFLLPAKIYSGYALTGKLPGGGWISSLHISPLVDALLLFAVIFHALYGIRVMCIDFGWVQDNRQIFLVFTIIGALLFALSFFILVW